MADNLLRSIVIVGGGSAGWMSAAALARSYGAKIPIRLIESDDIGTVGVGEATVPHLKTFNETLGIAEQDFVKAVQGTFKLGIQFVNWGRLGSSYIHGFGDIGHTYGMLPFYQYWLKAAQQGYGGDIGDYSIHTVAATRNKFMTSATDVSPNSPLHHIAHAYHFDAGLYARFLRQYAEKLGVVRTEGEIVDVELHSESGDVRSVRLKSGERVEGDLWIDCSGLRALLIEGALKTGYENWTHWLPCDRAVAMPCAKVEAPTPYTRSTARASGWQWRIPLQHRTGNGLVYSSAFMSDTEAEAELRGHIDGKALGDPRLIRFTTGRRRLQWNRNVVSVGLSSGFMEPLESTSIYLIQTGIGRLIELMPDRRISPLVRDRYNQQVAFEYERIRDFLILHYKATQRTDSAFWRHCGAMSIPDRLQNCLDLFLDSGRFFRENDEMFAYTSWVQVMIGQGFMPSHYHPAVDLVAEADLRQFVHGVRNVIHNCVEAMPMHDQFIARHYAAATP